MSKPAAGPLVPHVVVVGAGFAGLQAARALAGEAVRITVVDRRNHHLFQPLLYQVATAALDPSDIAFPIRAVFRGQRNVQQVLMAAVEDVDLEHRSLKLDDGSDLAFDKLILATGATHSYFGHDDWREHAPGLKTVEDALDIRSRVLGAFEAAERHPETAAEQLTFVVVGAGPTGVELAGALVEIARFALSKDYDRIDPSHARVLLVEHADRVLPPYPEELSASARRQLESLGVEVRTSNAVAAVDGGGVALADGTRVPSRTVLWAAGVQASPLAKALGVELDRSGRVPVAADLSVPGHADVFVVGDLAAAKSADTGRSVPGVAPAAMQGGRHAARQIVRDLQGRPREPFRYRDKGSLATIGWARAVADFGRFRFGGFPAWAAWMLIHVAFLIGVRNRLFVLLSWAWSYLTFRRGARLITGPSAAGRVAAAGREAAAARPAVTAGPRA